MHNSDAVQAALAGVGNKLAKRIMRFLAVQAVQVKFVLNSKLAATKNPIM